MSAYDLWTAVKTRWTTLWVVGSNPRTVTYFAGEQGESPPLTAPWVRISLIDGQAQVETLKFAQIGGSKSFDRIPGIVDIQFFVPLGEGQDRARGLADLGAVIFRKVTFSGIRCTVPYHQPVGPSDHWWQHNLICPYRYHELT